MATPEKRRSRARDAPIMDAEVPQRLRTERQRQGISVRELARRLEVSPSAISQIETGRARPSVSLLYSIVSELGLSLDQLFQGAAANGDAEAPGTATAGAGGGREFVQRAGSRVTIDLDTGVRWERLTPSADPEVDFLFVTYPPGSSSSPGGLMRHAGHEYGIVLSGRLEVTTGFTTQVLEVGDSIRFDSALPHRLGNPGDEPATGVWVVIGRGGSDARTEPLDVQQ
jgi:transcriptional regulator with XRE-family HTH domain